MRHFVIRISLIALMVILVQSTLGGLSKSEAMDLYNPASLQPIFNESFLNETLENQDVKDQNGQIGWHSSRIDEPNRTYDFYNALDQNGSMLLGGSEVNQFFSAELKRPLPLQFGMTFDFKIQSMANAGTTTEIPENRPIMAVIPRATDSTLTDYYAVLYTLENSKVNNLLANLFKCKWELVRVHNGTEIEVLTSGYYKVYEGLPYKGIVQISNDANNNVDIAFYLDGSMTPNKSLVPLLKYKDSSPKKISKGMSTIAFEVGGFDPVGFQFTPIVELTDVKAYDSNQMKELLKLWSVQYQTDSTKLKSGLEGRYIKYLTNSGILTSKDVTILNQSSNVSLSQAIAIFLKGSANTNPVDLSKSKGNIIEYAKMQHWIDSKDNPDRPVTTYDMARILYESSPTKTVDLAYKGLLSFKKEPFNAEAFHYAYQNNLMYFDAGKPIEDQTLTKDQFLTILLRSLGVINEPFNHELDLPYIIGNGTIFQRNTNLPIWGRGYSGDTITVELNGLVQKVKVVNGKWRVNLPPQTEGGPYSLTVRDSKKTLTLKDIYIGEVFLVSGQSNADWYLKNSDDAEATVNHLASAITSKELIYRYFKPQQRLSLSQNYSTKGTWYNMSEYLLNNSSAVGNFFVEKLLDLNPELKGVPIGLVSVAYGGSTIELFMPSRDPVNPYQLIDHKTPIYQGYWNGYISGIAPFKFKAAIYYQGENSVQLRYDYERMLYTYIQDFRKQFEDSDLPILLVQLTGFGESYLDGDTWPIIREAQYTISKMMNRVGLVTAVDLSDPNRWEIHPRNKKVVGERLAYKALNLVYSKGNDHISPEVDQIAIEPNAIRIHFSSVNGALRFVNGQNQCFEIYTEDGKWLSASGTIEKDNWIRVMSPNNKKPLFVRYAYSNYPMTPLYDDFMPVIPFNTQKPLPKSQMGQTTEFNLFLPYHGLNTWDAVVDHSKNNTFRTVKRVDAFNVTFEFAIKKISKGDKLSLLRREGGAVLEKGTTETVIKLKQHGLKPGDWIRNSSRKFADSVVLQVVDENTFIVNKIVKQSPGDSIEIYRLRAVKIL